jgi:hypothetical protein
MREALCGLLAVALRTPTFMVRSKQVVKSKKKVHGT